MANRRGPDPTPRRKGAGRPKGSGGEHVTIFTSDALILRKYPKALLGLIRARQAAEITGLDMARLIGVSSPQYHRLERGTSAMLLADARKVAAHLNIPLERLF